MLLSGSVGTCLPIITNTCTFTCIYCSSVHLQDLEELSDGLEGRSSNPVSLLFDTLMQPNTDIGEEHPPSLSWQHDPSKAISHVVVGSGRPGGSWHRMAPNIETVSFGHWLELPIYTFNQWKSDRERSNGWNGSVENPTTATVKRNTRKRALLGEVAQYYDDYVSKMELEENFMNGVEIVCATDFRRPKVNKPTFKSQSSSTCSSLSSSPCLDSPTHTVHATCTTTTVDVSLLHGLEQEDKDDTSHQQEGSDLTEHQFVSDDVFTAEDSEPFAEEIAIEQFVESRKSCTPSPTPLDNLTPPNERSKDCDENARQSTCTSIPSSPLHTRVTEPCPTECFSESSCCCFSDPDDGGIYCWETRKVKAEYKWCIRGRKRLQDKPHSVDVKILAKKVVLACGVGQPRRLEVPGENYPFVRHQYDNADTGTVNNDEISGSNPIMIVGAGLSAADAVLLALENGLKVVHAFYRKANDPELTFHNMPTGIYKEYRHVFALMQGKIRNENYTPLPQHRVVEFKRDGICTLANGSGNEETDLVVSSCYVLIGSEANLEFLPRRITSELGLKAGRPIHPKYNPIEIDPYSFQSDSTPSLYAMGPLVGDNFVRFVLGGALGITHHLTNSRSKEN